MELLLVVVKKARQVEIWVRPTKIAAKTGSGRVSMVKNILEEELQSL